MAGVEFLLVVFLLLLVLFIIKDLFLISTMRVSV